MSEIKHFSILAKLDNGQIYSVTLEGELYKTISKLLNESKQEFDHRNENVSIEDET